MGTEPILAMLLAMQLALNVGKHQRKTSQTRTQTLGVNGPLQIHSEDQKRTKYKRELTFEC